MNWDPPEKPAEITESRLVQSILDGVFPAGSNLPGERELAVQLGVTRPTLREVLQRMARDGWIEIRQGKPTRVRDYWTEGNLSVLVAAALQLKQLPPDFIPNLLDMRILICPAYTRMAVERNPQAVAALLEDLSGLDSDPAAFARFDWSLHRQVTILSGNPFFTMFVNTVRPLYEVVGERYFQMETYRQHSTAFYEQLRQCALRCDPDAAQALALKVMTDSANMWRDVITADRLNS